MDERALAERLITYDTSTLEGMQSAAGFVKGWLEARDVEVAGCMHNGRPVLAATVGRARSSSRRGWTATACTGAAPTT
jgi:succinyl-diaminopimelate desuccinylase